MPGDSRVVVTGLYGSSADIEDRDCIFEGLKENGHENCAVISTELCTG